MYVYNNYIIYAVILKYIQMTYRVRHSFNGRRWRKSFGLLVVICNKEIRINKYKEETKETERT